LLDRSNAVRVGCFRMTLHKAPTKLAPLRAFQASFNVFNEVFFSNPFKNGTMQSKSSFQSRSSSSRMLFTLKNRPSSWPVIVDNRFLASRSVRQESDSFRAASMTSPPTSRRLQLERSNHLRIGAAVRPSASRSAASAPKWQLAKFKTCKLGP
jgi:hypothetical protein